MAAQKTTVLFSEAEIAKTVRRLAKQVEKDYRDKDLVVIGILKGAFVFMSDLVREIDLPLQLDFIRAYSYGLDTRPTGPVQLRYRPQLPLAGKHVLLVEDIVDTGATTSKVIATLRRKKPASLKLCALLDKPSRRVVPVEIGYRGIEIPDVFVVGYGLDAAEAYRNLPYIAKLEST